MTALDRLTPGQFADSKISKINTENGVNRFLNRKRVFTDRGGGNGKSGHIVNFRTLQKSCQEILDRAGMPVLFPPNI